MEHIIEIRTDPTLFMEWFLELANSLVLTAFPTRDPHYKSYVVQVMNPLFHMASPRLGVDSPIGQGQPLELVFYGFYARSVESHGDKNGHVQGGLSAALAAELERVNVGCVMTVSIERVAVSGTSDSTRVRIASDASDMDHVSVLLRSIAHRWEHIREQYTAELLETIHIHTSESEQAAWQAMNWAPVPAKGGNAHSSQSTERYVLRQQGDVWELAFKDGQPKHLRDLIGLHYIQRLLTNPNVPHSVSELDRLVNKFQPDARAPLDEDLDAASTTDGGERYDVLDGTAKESYRSRLKEIHDEREQAKAEGDAEKEAALDDEVEWIEKTFKSNTGLGGRPRSFATPHNRARIRVRRAIVRAIESVGKWNKEFADYLNEHIETGSACCYRVGPDEVLEWEV